MLLALWPLFFPIPPYSGGTEYILVEVSVDVSPVVAVTQPIVLSTATRQADTQASTKEISVIVLIDSLSVIVQLTNPLASAFINFDAVTAVTQPVNCIAVTQPLNVIAAL